eukprot:gb/GECG01011931.1/.p1 GENE.gb/GECG01011931.1/~~gb/GECG01011931.1/.p1  ORF type:complete len:437 (+),score=80.91 gb/GECG01011931.1/:1-1311(+)
MKEVLSSVDMTVRRTIAENEHAVVELTYQSQQAEKLMRENEQLLRENRELQISNSLQEEHINRLSKKSVLMKHTIRESQRVSNYPTSVGEEASTSAPSREEDEESVKTFTSDMTDQSKALPSTARKDRGKGSSRLGSRGSRSFSSGTRVASAQPLFQKHSSGVFDSVTKQAITKAQTMLNSICSDILAEVNADKNVDRNEKEAVASALQQVRAKIENESKRLAGDVTKVRPVQDWSCDSLPFTEQGSALSEMKDSSFIHEEDQKPSAPLNATSARLHAPDKGMKAMHSGSSWGKQPSRFMSVASDPATEHATTNSEHRPQSEPPSPSSHYPRKHGYMLQGLKPAYVVRHEKPPPKDKVLNVPTAEPAKMLQQTGKQLVTNERPKPVSHGTAKQHSQEGTEPLKGPADSTAKGRKRHIKSPDSLNSGRESVEPWEAL